MSTGFGVLGKSEEFEICNFMLVIFARVVSVNFCESLGKMSHHKQTVFYLLIFSSIVLGKKHNSSDMHKSSIKINKVKVALLLYTIQFRPHLRSPVRTGTSHLKNFGTLFNKIHGRAPKIIKVLEDKKYTQ